MLKRISDFFPDISNNHNVSVLLYRNYRFTDKYPSYSHLDESLLFGEQCSFFLVELPHLCKLAYFRFPAYSITLKDDGEYQFIIIKKKHYGQNPLFRH